MLNVELNKNETKLVVKPIGRVDSVSAPDFDASFSNELEGINDLTFDFSSLEYISSAGLRILLAAVKKVGKNSSVQIENASQEIKDVLEMTGFDEIIKVI